MKLETYMKEHPHYDHECNRCTYYNDNYVCCECKHNPNLPCHFKLRDDEKQ